MVELNDECFLINYSGYKKDPCFLAALKRQKAKAKAANKGLSPIIDLDYYCETCGSSECHPVSGYCFVCDLDNWEPSKNSLTVERGE